MRNNKGFSLVELIVVIAIMAILAAVAIPTFATFISKAQIASDVDYMNQVESAVELAYAQKGDTIEKITVTLNSDNKATQIVVDFKTAADETIKPNDTNISAEAQEAALIIDWNYKFNKNASEYTTDSENPESWNDNWDFAS